ncbi:MAG: error-prone DNA polymerase [Gammaproteobacteria bacterium]|nr:error-prone DNA polymerase [Gammaproteobacteria bacterium]
MGYAELHAISNFTFLRGASHPEELVERAAELGYAALALTDECSVAGIVRALVAAEERGLKLIVGSELTVDDAPPDERDDGEDRRDGGTKIVVLAPSRDGYGALSTLITCARRAAAKGGYRLCRDDLVRHLAPSDCLVLWRPGAEPDVEAGEWLREHFPGRLWMAVSLLRQAGEPRSFERLRRVAARLGLPMTAAGDVHMHVPERRALQDTLTAIRLKTRVDALGFAAYSNGERHLRPRDELERLYPKALLDETLAIAERCNFSPRELRYEYPYELVPQDETPASHLRALTEQGMAWRWPNGAPEKVRRMVEHELGLIRELEYESYFLTVHDIVRFARERGILCQGRGSAANSAVCYCLGITEVDPSRMEMLFERFISKERNEPPDIDVDFEHERREEIIQYIYRKYSRERAALAATVITYQPRSAVRDVGKALGFDATQIDALAKSLSWWDGKLLHPERLAEAGLDPESPRLELLTALVGQLVGFPRHLSQHVGGFVISHGPLSRLVPIENAAMPERTVIQWDKDDLEELGLLKVDVLGLGMLTAIRRSFELIDAFYAGRGGPREAMLPMSLAKIPAEDPKVYDMISKADTVGVFQIESRAQMAMLPRLKPRCYYDLVIEVAIIRPGPIQGDMVHPYLRRRNGEEPVTYPSEEVRKVLERTLGVPIFQEQVMQLAIVAAGFTPGEADQLRRAMAAWRRRGDLGRFEKRLIDGMLERGYTPEFAKQIFEQIRGFGEYGFPESHSASFALLVYVSAWLKCYEPAAFFCALLNSQPMGFYAPAQLLRAARSHGVEIRPVDVTASGVESTLEPDSRGEPAIRLGFDRVKGLATKAAEAIVAARADAPFDDVHDLARRAKLDAKALEALAAAGALERLAGHRHRALWDVTGVERPIPLLETVRIPEGIPLLRRPTEGEDIVADYRRLGFTLGRHPLALLRSKLERMGVLSAAEVHALDAGARVHTAGMVITRQRPSSASGVIFVTLEDESGYVNLIVWPNVVERERTALLGARLLGVTGRIQKESGVLHVVVEKMHDYSVLLGRIVAEARNFR